MATCLYIATLVVLSFHVANSYILLTANLEDVNAIAKQIASSPVAQQLHKIIRRASSVFTQQLNQFRNNAQQRSGGDEGYDGNYQQQRPRSQEFDDGAASADEGRSGVERRRADDPLVALGRNASYYLASIKKIFQNV